MQRTQHTSSPAPLRVLLVACVWASLAFAVLLPRPAHGQDAAGDILGRTNALRASVGVGPLSINGSLAAAAQSQAQWMVETGNISHTRPDGSGPRTRALNAGYGSTDVSENIYGGTNASVGSAWNFWVNSGIHYASLVNGRYNEVGIGAAGGDWGTTYVMVFGNSGGGSAPILAPPSGGGDAVASSSGGGGGAASGPPAYFLGVDDDGNLLHEVQPGDTLGDIALIYGYTWGDIDMLMQLNNIADVRDLEVGTTFRVPPRSGSGGGAEAASASEADSDPAPTADGPTSTPTTRPPTITPYVYVAPTDVPTAMVFPTVVLVAPPDTTGVFEAAPTVTVQSSGTPSPTFTPSPTGQPAAGASSGGTAVAFVRSSEETVLTANVAPPSPERPTSVWVLLALALQGVLFLGAGFEFVRRLRAAGKKRRNPMYTANRAAGVFPERVPGNPPVPAYDEPQVEIRRSAGRRR